MRILTDLIELVLLAELHTLLPAIVALEEVGGDSPELNQLVLLEPLGQRDVVKVVVGVYRCPHGLGAGEEDGDVNVGQTVERDHLSGRRIGRETIEGLT